MQSFVSLITDARVQSGLAAYLASECARARAFRTRVDRSTGSVEKKMKRDDARATTRKPTTVDFLLFFCLLLLLWLFDCGLVACVDRRRTDDGPTVSSTISVLANGLMSASSPVAPMTIQLPNPSANDVALDVLYTGCVVGRRARAAPSGARQAARVTSGISNIALCFASARSICHSDVHQGRDEWGGAIFPMVPGHEIVRARRAHCAPHALRSVDRSVVRRRLVA